MKTADPLRRWWIPFAMLSVLLVFLLALLLLSSRDNTSGSRDNTSGLRPDDVHPSIFPEGSAANPVRWSSDCGSANPTHWAFCDDRIVYVHYQDQLLVSLDPATGMQMKTSKIPADLMPEGDNQHFPIHFVNRILYYKVLGGPIVRVSAEDLPQPFPIWEDAKKAIESDGGTLYEPPKPVPPYHPVVKEALARITKDSGDIKHVERIGSHLLVIHYVYTHRITNGGLVRESTRQDDGITLLDGQNGHSVWKQRQNSVTWIGMADGLAIMRVQGHQTSGILAGIDPMTGAPRWSLSTGRVVPESLRIVDGHLLIVSNHGSVAVIDAGTGVVEKRAIAAFTGRNGADYFVTPFQTSPCIRHGDAVVVCTSRTTKDGTTYTLHRLDLQDVTPVRKPTSP